MKTIKTIIILFSILITQFVMANTVTWNGGVGDWMNAGGWDTGTVPIASDEVVIPSGRVTIRSNQNGVAQNVHVYSGARLNVYQKGSLTIDGVAPEAGLMNEGRVYVWGILNMYKISEKSPLIGSAIKNSDYFFVGVNGLINIDDVNSGYGILNTSTGIFLNRGEIIMLDIDRDNIRNLGDFDNENSIELHDISTNGVLNIGTFTSAVDGVISLQDGNAGILNNPNASFTNFGLIDVDDTNYAVINKGTFSHEADSEIWVVDGIQGLTNRNYSGAGNGDMFCYGMINIAECVTAIRNESYLYNDGFIYSNANNSIALKNYDRITNDGTMTLNASSESVINEGVVYNHLFMAMTSKFDNSTSSADFENNGFFVSCYNGQHVLDAQAIFENNGIVEDHYNAFSGSGFDNQQVYLHRISEQLVDGNTYSDLIEIVDDSNVSFSEWKDINTNPYNEVGTFDVTLNEFSANSFAEDLDRIYISISCSGFSRNSSLWVDNNTTSRLVNTQSNEELSKRSSDKESEIAVYPNPCVSNINIEFTEMLEASIKYRLYDSMGKCVLTQGSEMGDWGKELFIPSSVTSGTYNLVIMEDDEILTTKLIQVIK